MRHRPKRTEFMTREKIGFGDLSNSILIYKHSAYKQLLRKFPWCKPTELISKATLSFKIQVTRKKNHMTVSTTTKKVFNPVQRQEGSPLGSSQLKSQDTNH